MFQVLLFELGVTFGNVILQVTKEALSCPSPTVPSNSLKVGRSVARFAG